MWRKFLIMGTVLGFSMMLLSASTWAGCEQQDLEGTWSAEVWGGGSSERQCWDQCTVTVGSDGVVAAGGAYVDCLGLSSEITGGWLSISSGCVVEGYIETSIGTLYVETGAIDGDKLVLGTAEE